MDDCYIASMGGHRMCRNAARAVVLGAVRCAPGLANPADTISQRRHLDAWRKSLQLLALSSGPFPGCMAGDTIGCSHWDMSPVKQPPTPMPEGQEGGSITPKVKPTEPSLLDGSACSHTLPWSTLNILQAEDHGDDPACCHLSCAMHALLQDLLFPDALFHLPGQVRAQVHPLQQARGGFCSGSGVHLHLNLTASCARPAALCNLPRCRMSRLDHSKAYTAGCLCLLAWHPPGHNGNHHVGGPGITHKV